MFAPSTLKKQTISASEPNIYKSSTFQTEFVVMKSTLHTAMTRITTLESKLQNFEKTVENCEKQIKSLMEHNKTLQESVQTLENQKSAIQNKYDNLQKEVSEKTKLIKENKESNDSIRNNLEKLTAEQNAKFTTYDAFKKRINTPIKNLEHFDPIATGSKIKSLEQAEQSLSSQVATLKKQLLALKSYANSVSPQKSTSLTDTTSIKGTKTPSQCPNPEAAKTNENENQQNSGATNSDSLFENIKRKQVQALNKTQPTNDTNLQDKQEHETSQSVDDLITKNISKIREMSDTTSKAHGRASTHVPTSPLVTHILVDIETNNTNGETTSPHDNRSHVNGANIHETVDLTSPSGSQRPQPQSMFKGSKQAKPKSTDKSSNDPQRKQEPKTFKGVTRKNTTRYYIGHIDSSSTYTGLVDFLEEQELTPTMIHMFKTRNGEYAARVNIPSDQTEIIESSEIPWPDGVVVNKWMSKYQLRQQRNSYKDRTNNKQHSENDIYYQADRTERHDDILRVYKDKNQNTRQVTYHSNWLNDNDENNSYDGYRTSYENEY